MDFSISDKMQARLDTIQDFVKKELIPLEPAFLKRDFKDLIPLLHEKRDKVKKMGLWGPQLPKELGGMGLSLLDFGLVSEALGGCPVGHYVFGCQAPDAGNIEILHLHGSEKQKEKYLKPLANGEIRSCFSMTEVDMPGF